MNGTVSDGNGLESLYRSLADAAGGTAVSVILKLRGETCDIDCLYCYEKRKEAPGGARITAEQVRELSALFPDRSLAVELHGGEPLSAGKEQVGTILRELAGQPRVVRVSLQTNGVRLDDAWLDLFDALMPSLRIGVSLDGDSLGNSWRVGYDAKPTYPQVVRALGLLATRGRKVGVIAAVTSRTVGRAVQVLDHLASFPAINAISFVPCLDSGVTTATEALSRRPSASRELQRASIDPVDGPTWATTPDAYAEFVLAAGARWISAGYFRRLSLEPVVSTIRRLRGLGSGFCHFSNLKCDHVFTVYPDGRLGGCDELPWPAAQLATLASLSGEAAVVRAQRVLPLREVGRSLMTKCVTCAYRDTCGGGCIATRLRYAARGHENAYCDYRMRLVDGTAALLVQPPVDATVPCRTLRWRPRRPNSMRDVSGFLRRWDDPAAARSTVVLRTSTYGNINTVGEAGVYEADDLDPAHDQWRDGIEPGAWPLVNVVTTDWGCVTYDSCGGHDYTQPNTAPAVRKVGVLPRDKAEYSAIAAALCRVARDATGQLPGAVRLVISRAELTCERSGDHHPVLDIVLGPGGSHDWPAYFADLDLATDILTTVLRRHAPSTATSCGCETTAPEGAEARAVPP